MLSAYCVPGSSHSPCPFLTPSSFLSPPCPLLFSPASLLLRGEGPPFTEPRGMPSDGLRFLSPRYLLCASQFSPTPLPP